MSELSIADSWAFCNRILVDVSRSFALIIPRCPPPIDHCLCVGYLLCRIADTIEDDARLTSAQRAVLYDGLLGCVEHPSSESHCEEFIRLWPQLPTGSYGELIRGARAVLHAFESVSEAYREPIARCVHEMVAGMRSVRVVERINDIDFYCRDLSDLDRYCHYVAGTVGVMSTALFERYLSEHRRGDTRFIATEAWREQGRRMGLGLQMTNIIKDAAGDAARGVSFIPIQFLDIGKAKLSGVVSLLTHEGSAILIRRTLAHLDEAITYAMALPGQEIGLRTFLLGSILPALATLELVAVSSKEFPKIDRRTMMDILSFIETNAGDNNAIREFFDSGRRRCADALVL